MVGQQEAENTVTTDLIGQSDFSPGTHNKNSFCLACGNGSKYVCLCSGASILQQSVSHLTERQGSLPGPDGG